MDVAARAELSKGAYSLAFLTELSFATATERYWTGAHILTHEAEEWSGVGVVGPGAISIEASEDFHANGLQLGIVGLPGDALRNVRLLTPDEYKGRAARFMLAVMSSDFQSVIWAHERNYFMDTLDYSFGGDSGGAVTIGLETETRYGSRRSIRRHSDQDQQSRFAGDLAFEFVPFINSGVEVKWGVGGAFFR